MRIVGGKFGGRRLAAPRSRAIRPTSDRTREAIFNVISHQFSDRLQGGRVLDLFAGTGALGLEALSRGAEFCLFVEEQVEARALIRSNVEAFGLQGRSKVFRRDAARLGEAGAMGSFDLVFTDPPYGKGLGERALNAALTGGWLAEDALCVAEEAAGSACDPGSGFRIIDERVYGDSIVRFLETVQTN